MNINSNYEGIVYNWSLGKEAWAIGTTELIGLEPQSTTISDIQLFRNIQDSPLLRPTEHHAGLSKTYIQTRLG